MAEEQAPESATIPGRDVFISYASQDAATAGVIVKALESHGITCWIAPRDVTPGSHYADGIMSAISGAKALVLVLSGSALTSNHVGKEVERASSKGRPIIAIHTDAAPLTPAFEYFLSESQWIDVGVGGLATVAAKLVEAVRLHLDTPVVSELHALLKPPIVPRAATLPRWRWAVAGGAILSLACAYFIVDKLWLSRPVAEKPSVGTAPVSVPVTPAIPEKSIAVLPFVDMSEKKDQEYFTDGLSEELIDKLSKIPGLHVPARTSSFFFKSKQSTISDIARTLGVTHVLEGSVRKSGNALRITVQLIRADNGYHLWSETYDRKLDDIFKVQDEIAGVVVKALKMSLAEAASPHGAATTNTEAYTLYLQARSLVRRATEADIRKGIGYLQRALQLDPGFAPAWAALASARVDYFDYFETSDYQKVQAEGHKAADQAVRLDPNLSDAHLALGRVLYETDWDWDAAEGEFNRALELDPGNAEALLAAAGLAVTRGQLERSLRLAQAAAVRDPVNPFMYLAMAQTNYLRGNTADSETAFRKGIELNPTAAVLHYWFGVTLIRKGEPVAALEQFDLEPDAGYRAIGRPLALDALGRGSEAERDMAMVEKTQATTAAANIADFYICRKDLDKAFAWLERAYRQRDTYLPWMTLSPCLHNIQADPRYNALRRQMKLPE